MKSKNIPADIRGKSIKEAQNEIKEIIEKLENTETKLENSIEKFLKAFCIRKLCAHEVMTNNLNINKDLLALMKSILAHIAM